MAGEMVYLIHNLARHAEAGSIMAIDVGSCVKAYEVVPTLIISSWSSGNCPYAVCSHTVIMSFMSLDILAKFDLAMGMEIKPAVEHMLVWTWS